MTPTQTDPAVALVFAIIEAEKRPGTQPAELFAIARRFLDERAAQERERTKDWQPSTDKPADWETEYSPVQLTGKTLEAMQYLSHWALAQSGVPFSVIAASDHVWCFADRIRHPS